MKGSRLLIVLLLLATVLVDCAVLVAAGQRPSFPNPVLISVWALQISQVSLAAIWLGLGRKPAPLRLVGAVAVAALWSWALSTLPDAGNVEQWAVLLMAHTAAVSVPLLAVRSLGLQLVDVSAAKGAEKLPAGPQRLQFSIGYLLGWTTALAVIMSILHYVAPHDHTSLKPLAELPVVPFVIGRAVMVPAAVWAALGTRWWALRVLVLPVTSATAFGVILLAEPLFAGGAGYSVLLCFLEAVLLVGSLCVFRVAGYRLRVRRSVGDDQNADDVCQGR